MFHPSQFEVNEAWIVFILNEEPIYTEHDGAFNCICLMDAASCFILANALVPLGGASALDARRLFKAAHSHEKNKPSRLFVPADQLETNLSAEARRQAIEVVPVEEAQLAVFIGEARHGFKEHVRAGVSGA